MAYTKVLSPLAIRGLKFSNRLVMAPMHVNLADRDGHVTDALIEFYRPMAENRVGTIIVGAATVEVRGKFNPLNLCAMGEDCIEGFSRLFGMMVERDVVPGIQLSHAGRQILMHTSEPLVAPSAIPAPLFGGEVRALTRDEILVLEDKFAEAARLLWQAGARLVEIHCGHGFLLNQFISPVSNHRKDDYGGSLENRLRIMTSILRKIKERVDERLILSCRISSEEFVEGGITLPQSCQIASMLSHNGADIIHVSGGVAYASAPMLKAVSESAYVKNAEVIRKHIKAPVIAVGGINSLRRAEEILESGAADFVAMGRALVADPQLITKSLAGREHEVNTCLDCNACYRVIEPECPPIGCVLHESPAIE